MKKAKGIDINPNIMFGKPVIAGTRIPVEIILEKLADGIPTEEVLQDYPRLTKTDIREALLFANRLVKRSSSMNDYTTFHKVSR
mgnify:CR=1 FL=1